MFGFESLIAANVVAGYVASLRVYGPPPPPKTSERLAYEAACLAQEINAAMAPALILFGSTEQSATALAGMITGPMDLIRLNIEADISEAKL